MFRTVNKCFLLQSTDVCEQILRVVSRSNRLEELVLENAGLRTWVFSWICEHVALCHLPFWSVHDLLKKFKCTQIVFPSGKKNQNEPKKSYESRNRNNSREEGSAQTQRHCIMNPGVEGRCLGHMWRLYASGVRKQNKSLVIIYITKYMAPNCPMFLNLPNSWG